MAGASGMFAFHKIIKDQKYIYFFLGAFVFLVDVFLFFAIKDVDKDDSIVEERQQLLDQQN